MNLADRNTRWIFNLPNKRRVPLVTEFLLTQSCSRPYLPLMVLNDDESAR